MGTKLRALLASPHVWVPGTPPARLLGFRLRSATTARDAEFLKSVSFKTVILFETSVPRLPQPMVTHSHSRDPGVEQYALPRYPRRSRDDHAVRVPQDPPSFPNGRLN